MSKKYFSKLNYTLANEDTSLEYGLVKQLKPKAVLTVCGSGGRSLPLVAATSDKLVCADLSEQQLLLAQHREATFRQLSWREFLMYWGFPPFRVSENKAVRKEIFESLNLQDSTHAFFLELYESLNWTGLIYEGKWEKTFTGIPKLLRRVIGGKYDNIFDFKNLDEQRAFFDRELQKPAWRMIPRLVLRVFGNAAFFNALLYKGHFVKKNVQETHYEYYRTAYRNMLYQGLTRENFFLQLTFLGRLQYPEGNPIEAQRSVFEEIKTALNTARVHYVRESLIDYGQKGTDKFDFVSLSDVPSYFSEHLDQQYLQMLRPSLNHGALVVVRCYLRCPENTDLSGFEDVSREYQALIDAEKTQVYRVLIYRYTGEV